MSDGEGRTYVVGGLPGRKRAALYRIAYPADGSVHIQPLAFFRDEDDLAKFVRDVLRGQRVFIAEELADVCEGVSSDA